MKKPFDEVFNTLKLNEYQKLLVKNIDVEKITIDKKKTNLTVYVVSKVIITHKDISSLEEIMSIGLRINVTIVERFKLTKEYTPKELFYSSKEDIAKHLKNYGILLNKMLLEAEIEFKDDIYCNIKLPRLYAYEIKIEEFKSRIEKYFSNKFGLVILVKIELINIERSAHRVSKVGISAINISNKSIEKNEKIEIPNVKEEKIEAKEVKNDKKKKSKFSKIIKNDLPNKSCLLKDIANIPGEYIFDACIIKVDSREIRAGLYIMNFVITDFTDSLSCKMFVNEEEFDEVSEFISKGKFIRIKGKCEDDRYDKEFMMVSLSGLQEIESFKAERKDVYHEKRIELCAHTKMSKMESVCDIKDLIKTAYNWGHSAISISDVGVVHGFPNAKHVVDGLKDFKIIYGLTANMVDDSTSIVENADDRTIDCDIVVFDIETTGFNASSDKIIEIGAVKIKNGKIEDEFFQEFVNPLRPLPYEIINITNIHDHDLVDADTIDIVLPKFLEFCKGSILCAHNASFDMSFIKKNARDLNLEVPKTVVDTLVLSRRLVKDIKSHKLNKLAKRFKIDLKNAHRAKEDAKATGEVLLKLIEIAKTQGVKKLSDLNTILALEKEDIKKLYPYNASVLIRNEVGRVNLYTLVSISHLQYFHTNAKIPKSILKRYREGLLIGTGNIDGELQQAILRGKQDFEIYNIMEFYDYVEVQPPSHYMADTKNFTDIKDVYNFIRQIIKVGERLNKPVVATGDVCFIEKEDEIYRKIVKYADKKQLKISQPKYFMTTDEMMIDFAFLGEEKAKEIVIDNTHKINQIIDNISPVRPDKCPPVIENSDIELREMCYKKAHEIYGEVLPDVVKNRLEKELTSIIGNGFAVMYIIAQKLVKKSNDDGYMVGSRGSVGSSFVATMSGITEVNPLPAHYYCKNCHYSDFDSDVIKAHEGLCGCDLPDMLCPECGEKLEKEGFEIPFETFLGFKGNKEPDIDLNFSGEYQNRAHKETEVIFGKGQTFRAGTISGVAEKTAFDYTRKYLAEVGEIKRNCEIERIASGVKEVKRTTGQHPGGIIVLPKGENIYSFTPIQRPADDEKSDIITTHFDYHSIDHNLLKLDILGHDDPTMIRRLEDLTGIDAKSIPLDEPKVMSIFHSPKALGIEPKDILGCEVGCRGIPEFGTDFTINMVIDTKPKNFTDLLKISGLSHGTDVWVGNAKELIDTGKATISECICTRDDIMTFLIFKGLDEELAFTIMESVRKGKGLKPEWEDEIRKHGIPDWYIWSCNKIKYMFPKAHAVAYVMMAYRIAYFKVYYPLEYYTAFFSIRANAFDYKDMCLGQQKLEHEIKKYREMELKSATEKDKLKDMLIVQEFYARGYEFEKIDLYKAEADRFKIINGKVMPSLAVIESLGEKAANMVVSEAKKQAFISKDDLKNRCKISNTAIETLTELGIIDMLPDSNQISIFDIIN